MITLRLKKWSDIHQFARHGWLYRGQASVVWPLSSSLERQTVRSDVAVDKRADLERRLIREFQRAYHQYASRLPPETSIIEWLSLMQHHGAPTRLVDFTYSVYVAAYFALETADDDCVVWAVNGPWACQQAVNILTNAHKEDPEKAKDPFTEDHEQLAKGWFFEAPIVQLVYPINPFRLNERLRIQRGVFLIPGDVSKPFMENIRAMPENDDPKNVVKIIIPKSERKSGLNNLFYMNIARSSLFPGLDGYAQSLGVYHSAYEPTLWSGSAEPMPLPPELIDSGLTSACKPTP